MGFSRESAPRVKQTGLGSKYRYKLTYPNGYVKYVRWPEQMPKEVSNPMDKKRMDEKVQQNKSLIAEDILALAKAMEPDFEKTVRELADINWAYHKWYQKHDDEITALLEVKYGKEAAQRIREYRKARSAVTSALVEVADFINVAVDKQG
jgi:delta 1-pyrroline-5-carboxylate dehydrogenase